MGEFGKVNENTYFGDGVNWDAISHEQLWAWFSDGRTGGMEGAVSYWGEKIAGHFQAAADKVTAALTEAKVVWEGQAVDAMTSGTVPLADHAQLSTDSAVETGGVTGRQAADARGLAMMMPEPRPMPTQQQMIDAAGGNMFLYLHDVAEQESASKEAAERARDLAKGYDRGTDDAVSQLPRFTSAPVVTTDVADSASPGPGVIEYGQPVSGPPEGDPDGAPAGPPGPNGPGGPGGSGGSSSGPGSVSQAPPAASQDAVTPGGTSSQGSAPPVSASPPATGGPQGPTGGLGSTGGFGPTGGLAPGLVVGGPGGAGGSAGGGRSTGSPSGLGPGGRGEAGHGARGGPGSGVRAAPGAIEEPISRGGQAAPTRAGAGMTPMTAGAPRNRDETDEEHTTPTYLVDHHDDFWDDTPAVAPAVIGEDDD